jgi:hypothetical protein
VTFVQPGYRPEIVPLTRRLSLATGGNVPASVVGLSLLGSLAREPTTRSFFPLTKPIVATAGVATLGLGAGGFAIDYTTGAIYRHEPNNIRVVMTRIQSF